MAITIKQISELSGVSRGTVDRVLNDRGHVDPQKAKLVRQIAKQLGYQPNMAGKALAARRKSYMIGVLLCSEGNPFFEEVLRGVHAAAKELADFGVHVKLHTIKGYDETQLAASIHTFAPELHALVLTPVNSPAVAAEISAMADAGQPVVTVNTDIAGSRRACYVGSDYAAGGRVACGMLRLLTGGVAEVGILTGSLHVLGHTQRVDGFRAAARQSCPGFRLAGLTATEDDDIIGYNNAAALLADHPDINALFLAAAGVYGVCRAVQDAHCAVPPKIVCFDPTPQVQELMHTGVIQAAIEQQPYRQGYYAVQTAYRCLLTGEPPKKDQIIMKNHIVIRESLPG